MSDLPWPDPRVPYEYPGRTDANELRWRDAVATSLHQGTLTLQRKGQHRDLYQLAGSCPRCSHGMDVEIEFSVIVGLETGIYNVDCNCNKEHDERADDESGCGWGGWIGVPLERPAS